MSFKYTPDKVEVSAVSGVQVETLTFRFHNNLGANVCRILGRGDAPKVWAATTEWMVFPVWFKSPGLDVTSALYHDYLDHIHESGPLPAWSINLTLALISIMDTVADVDL